MKMKIGLSDLSAALKVVSTTAPPSAGGYLFVVRGQQCHIYSQDTQQNQMRATVNLTEVEGEGAFIYPLAKVSELDYLDGWIEIESGKDEENNRTWIRYRTEGGATAEHTTQNPEATTFDKDLAAAEEKYEYPAVLLATALRTVKSYLAPVGEDEKPSPFHGVQVFDASKPEWEKGDGHVFAADSYRSCYFYCDLFKGKGLTIHGKRIDKIVSFLDKCEGDVKLLHGSSKSFLVNAEGTVIGWQHFTQQYDRFSYYSLKSDNYQLRMPKDIALKALNQVKAGLDKGHDKMRITYDHSTKTVQFQATDGSTTTTSIPFAVEPVVDEETKAGASGVDGDLGTNVNVHFLHDMLNGMKAQQVILRAAVVQRPNPGGGTREAAVLRCIEDFRLTAGGKIIDAQEDSKETSYLCRVTRFMGSKD